MNIEQIGIMIGRLSEELREELSVATRKKLIMYIAATELMAEDTQPDDRGTLRLAAAHLALQSFGITDANVERCKDLLASGRDTAGEAVGLQ